MSIVSVLPFGDTFAYWWRKLDGEPGRHRFMALKALEASAFIGNRLMQREGPITAPNLAAVARQQVNTVPDNPVVVVVVPVYCQGEHDAHRVDTLLRGIAMQTHACQTVLVDDGSPHWAPWSGVQIVRLEHNLGPAAARNRGLDRAIELGAHVVAFTDSDCLPGPDWIRSLVSAFQRERRAHAISGATWSLDRSALGRYQERNGTLNGRRLHGEDLLLYGPTCNLALCAELARSIRFDESFRIAAAEDIDLCYRLNLQGWSIYHAEDAVVRHDYGYDALGLIDRFRRLWSQFRRYARGERLLLQKHPAYIRVVAASTEIPLRDAAMIGTGTPTSPLPRTVLGELQRKLSRVREEDPNVYPLW